jgi:hypothetical protein
MAKKIIKSELSEMLRTLIEKSEGGGEFRVLACADTGSEDPPWHAPVLKCEKQVLLVKNSISNITRECTCE